MAEYGRPQYPTKSKKGLKDLSTGTICAYVLIPMIMLKLIIGGIYWLNIFGLCLFLLLLVTMIDSVVQKDWVRAYDRRKMRLVKVFKREQPFDYWSNVITAWPCGMAFAFIFLTTIKPD